MNSEAQVLRIALVCPYSLSRPGGVQGQVIGLARVLERRGHRVSVFAPIDDPRDKPEGIDLVAAGRSTPLPSNGSRAPVSVSPRAAAHALAELRLGRFDVVHTHEPFAPGLTYGLLVAGGIPPVVATFHRSGNSLFYSLLGPLARRRADRRFAVRCAVSPAAKATARSAIGGEFAVLFNGVEVDRFSQAVPWPTEGPTVLFLGRHEERKGLRVLLDAFNMLDDVGDRDDLVRTRGDSADRLRQPTLWVAGDGPETERLRRLAPESGRIHWLGVLSEEEKVQRLAAADILCAPSLGGESFGMVLLEAMAARTLVVASDIDGYRDAVGSDAVLVTPGNPAALAEALTEAFSGWGSQDGGAAAAEAPLTRLDAAFARAERWSMSRLAAEYEQIYRQVVVGPVT